MQTAGGPQIQPEAHGRHACQSPTAPGSATPKPHASASRHGCRNHPFQCLTLLSEPVKKKALRRTYAGQRKHPFLFQPANVKSRRTPRVPKRHGPRLRHTETPCQCESTRLPKPPFPAPNVAFRTGKEESFTPNLSRPM